MRTNNYDRGYNFAFLYLSRSCPRGWPKRLRTPSDFLPFWMQTNNYDWGLSTEATKSRFYNKVDHVRGVCQHYHASLQISSLFECEQTTATEDWGHNFEVLYSSRLWPRCQPTKRTIKISSPFEREQSTMTED